MTDMVLQAKTSFPKRYRSHLNSFCLSIRFSGNVGTVAVLNIKTTKLLFYCYKLRSTIQTIKMKMETYSFGKEVFKLFTCICDHFGVLFVGVLLVWLIDISAVRVMGLVSVWPSRC